jgi:hypothetical protein
MKRIRTNKSDRNGNKQSDQVLEKAMLPAINELIASAKNKPVTKQDIIERLEQIISNSEGVFGIALNNSPIESTDAVTDHFLLNSIEWWRKDLFLELLHHDTLGKYIHSLGGNNAVIFLYEPLHELFFLERGKHIEAYWRSRSLYTRGYPPHKIDAWKKTPISARNPVSRLQHTGYRLYIRNQQLLNDNYSMSLIYF